LVEALPLAAQRDAVPLGAVPAGPDDDLGGRAPVDRFEFGESVLAL